MVVTFHQSKNGTESQATGTDISSWVSYDSTKGATFSVASAASYRTASASKAIPAFDVMDYGQEDYVFGSAKADARHWSRYVLDLSCSKLQYKVLKMVSVKASHFLFVKK